MRGEYEFDSPYWDNISLDGQYFASIYCRIPLIAFAAKDFIRRMLVVDPRHRIDAPGALKHRFLAKYRPTEKELSQSVDEDLAYFSSIKDIPIPKVGNEDKGTPEKVGRRASKAKGDDKKDDKGLRKEASLAKQRLSEVKRAIRVTENQESVEIPIKPKVADEKDEKEKETTPEKHKALEKRASSKEKQKEEKEKSGSGEVEVALAMEEGRRRSHAYRPSTADARVGLRVLSFNIFLRPPGVKNNTSDYKEARMAKFIETMLDKYDVIGLQEMFGYGSGRLSRLQSAAKKRGLEHSVSSPPRGLLNGMVDGGLVVLSRHPIAKTAHITFKKGVHSDR
jgi:serine/threonine protein kinase